MANNLSPDILAQILAMYGGAPSQSQNGVNQWFGSGDLKDYNIAAQQGGSWQGGDAGGFVAGPEQRVIRHNTPGGMADVYDDKGQFVEQDTQSDDSTANMLKFLAGSGAMFGAGSLLSGLGGAAGASSGLSGLDAAALDGAGGISGGNAALWGNSLPDLASFSGVPYGGGADIGGVAGMDTATGSAIPGGFTGSFDATLSSLPDAATSFGLGPSPLGGAALDATVAGGIGAGLPAYGSALGALGAVGGAAGGGGGLLSSIGDLTGIHSLADLSKLAPLAALIKGPDDPPTVTQTRTLDPRLDAAAFGSGGLLDSAKTWFDANKATGQNDAMRAAHTQLRNVFSSPEYLGLQAQQANSARGLLGGSVAGNPFANWKFPGQGG
jgi:hypothetical protein